MADHIELIVFLVGLILLLIEVLVIPGFGVTGILGLLAIFTSFFMTLVGNDPTANDLLNAGATLSGSFILSLLGLYFLAKYLPDTKMLDFIIVRGVITSYSIHYTKLYELSYFLRPLKP